MIIDYRRRPKYGRPSGILCAGPGVIGKTKGYMGMTWRLKVQGVVIAVFVLATLALASGAQWVDAFSTFDLGW
jgi:hypothetical protein